MEWLAPTSDFLVLLRFFNLLLLSSSLGSKDDCLGGKGTTGVPLAHMKIFLVTKADRNS